MSRGGSGYLASFQDPRYVRSVEVYGPNVDGSNMDCPTPEARGVIFGSLFRGEPRSYALFTGGLDQLAEVGNEMHPLNPIGLPYQQGFTRPTMAGPLGFRPKLSAFVNKALGAANADRTPATRSPMPLPVERSFAVPRMAFWDQFPSKPNEPLIRRHFGYVTQWPQAQMTYKPMGGSV